MKFPTIVYRCPGVHQCPGGTFDYKSANNEGELASLIKTGWFPTLPFAQNPGGFNLEEFLKPLPELVVKPPQVSSPPPVLRPDPSPKFKDLSRRELESRARDLGIGFSKNIKDETLAERIIQTLEVDGE